MSTFDVPAGIRDVTAQWLTAALGRPVADVRAEQIAQDSGFSSLLYRLHLTGDGVPATVIAKLPAQSEARGAMELLGGYRRELAFYQQVAGVAPMATPHVYAAEIDDRIDGTADFVLLLEDLAHWDNADHLAGLVDEADQGVHRRAGGLARVVDGQPPRSWTRSRASTPRSRATCWYPRSGRVGRSTARSRRHGCLRPSTGSPNDSPNVPSRRCPR